MEQEPQQTFSPAMQAAMKWLGKIVTHDGKTWRVSVIRAEHPDKPWAWMVNVKKPAEQVRLSLKAECFQ